MDSRIGGYLYVLNNLTSDFDLQLELLKRRIGNEEKTLTVEEMRAEMILWYERLHINPSDENGEELEELALFGGQFKGNAEIAGRLGIGCFIVKIVCTMVEIMETQLQVGTCHAETVLVKEEGLTIQQ
jgi:hypothetical protein